MRQKEYSFQHSKSWLLSGLYLSTLFHTNNETKRVLFPTLKKLAIEWSQYSKWLILSGLHLYLCTLFDANNETKRVLFPTLKNLAIEWSSLISKYSF